MGVFSGSMSLLDFLIIPFSLLTGLALSHLHLPFLFIFVIWVMITYLFVLHSEYGLTLSFCVRAILSMAVKIFFRDIGYNGTHKIPESGPLIFVCAPHANQFLDPILVMGCTTRPLGFLAAAKSMRRKYIGMFAKALNSIPVERPQDLATAATGKVTTQGKTVLGEGTTFTTQLQVGWSLVIKGETYAIQTIDSDTKLTISAAMEEDVTTPSSFQFAPKVDQNAVFDMVYNALRIDHCVGIFPEGGSHDRTDLLPLKAGCTIMALGAMNKYPDLNVRIIPVGLNYFNGHRFRSRAFIDIGDPIEISKDLVQAFGQGGAAKRDACGALLDQITKSLHGVTCVVPDAETLQLLWAIRRLYQPSGMPLTTDQKLELTRRFEKGYEQMKSHPRVTALLPKVLEYNQQRRILGLHDHQVAKISDNLRFIVLTRVIYRTILLFFYALFALPGLVLNAPVAILARVVSQQKAVEALKASTVKIKGRDVLATWKVMVAAALLPLCFIIYPLIAAIYGWYKGWGAIKTWAYFALLQPLMMYGSVRFVETGRSIALSLRPLLYALTQHTAGTAIRTLRTQVQKDIRDLVEELGPQVFGEEFESIRVIKSDDIRKKSLSAQKHTSIAERARASAPITTTADNPNMNQFPDLDGDLTLSPRASGNEQKQD